MTIAILAHDSRKELALQFCTAYSAILSKNVVIATGTTGRMLAQTTGLPVHCYLSGKLGGVQQITSRVACDEVDLVLFFRDPLKVDASSLNEQNLLRLCECTACPLPPTLPPPRCCCAVWSGRSGLPRGHAPAGCGARARTGTPRRVLRQTLCIEGNSAAEMFCGAVVLFTPVCLPGGTHSPCPTHCTGTPALRGPARSCCAGCGCAPARCAHHPDCLCPRSSGRAHWP
mgnify:CR=1 FL=1